MTKRTIILVCVLAVWASLGQAEEIVAPSARVTIYPGEIIQSDMLTESIVDVRETRDVARSRADLIGYIARRTLLAGRPISVYSVDVPKAIANGSVVQLVYEHSGISINATGQALQGGRTGDPIRVRNSESGLVVNGIVRSPGVVMVGR